MNTKKENKIGIMESFRMNAKEIPSIYNSVKNHGGITLYLKKI